MGLKVSYHKLALPVRVKQNFCTFATYEKLCVSIQSFVLNRGATASSSGLPENSGLKWDQFNCGIWTEGAGGNIGLGTCAEGFCGCTGFGTCTGGFCGCTGSGMCAGGSGAGGSCGLGGALSGTWSGCKSTSTSSWGWGPGCGGFYCGGSTILACSVALVFVGLCVVGNLGAGGPFSAIFDLV